MVGCRLCLYQVQVQVEGRDVGRIMVVKVVKAKVVTCRVGQSETRVPRIAAACRVCRVRRRWETCEQSKRIRQLFFFPSLPSLCDRLPVWFWRRWSVMKGHCGNVISCRIYRVTWVRVKRKYYPIVLFLKIRISVIRFASLIRRLKRVHTEIFKLFGHFYFLLFFRSTLNA